MLLHLHERSPAQSLVAWPPRTRSRKSSTAFAIAAIACLRAYLCPTGRRFLWTTSSGQVDAWVCPPQTAPLAYPSNYVEASSTFSHHAAAERLVLLPGLIAVREAPRWLLPLTICPDPWTTPVRCLAFGRCAVGKSTHKISRVHRLPPLALGRYEAPFPNAGAL